jgi:hypothetical protein
MTNDVILLPNYDLEQAAERLGCKRRWLEDNYRRLGFYQEFGREVRFDDLDLSRIKEACRSLSDE